ncbi:protein FAM98A isoform X2 [Coccinella septempunctata]|uniref:protein FAM98A isoform X2 n=1 Tax=Coccinella septempunctata TaxID=41139 RepID=UPI001D07B1AF|nr:protein FAM98A isoform X2 [Coccinella septempunctata]
MEEKIISGLKDLGYQGSLIQKGNLRSSLEYGPKSIEYTKLVNYLTTELRTLENLDEQVNAISSPEDSVSFTMEIGSFLKELNCPYQSLTQGHVSDRLQNVEDRELLLDYLITELMIARMNQEKMPKAKIELKLQETQEASYLKEILMSLGFPKPSEVTIQIVFRNLISKIEEIIKKNGVAFIGKAFFSGFLSDKQWKILSQLEKELRSDYKIRREMLLTRLDVTIQSFQWSDRAKGKEDFFQTKYKPERSDLHIDPDVDLSHLLAARTDLAIIEKTSSANVRRFTRNSIQKVIIGQVPDRGGRTNEIAPPPPEMPSWQQRTPGPQNMGRGGGFNQSRGRGNYNQGNGRGSYNQSGGQQSFSKSDSQFNSGRGDNEERGNYNSRTSSGNYGGDRQSNYTAYDSAGSYDTNKRVKSYDNFRTDNASYSDQYVRDTEHNQQNHSRNGSSRGRSNYHRGQGNRYKR